MTYVFEDRETEHQRLLAQGQFLDPLTRRLLHEAGLESGMSVLDLGSGAGNVSRLAAEVVGPTGTVVGVDASAEAVELATCQTDATNVVYRVGDVQELATITERFDAVVGRLVLAYVPDPVAVLREAASLVRPGGLVCLHEGDFSYRWTDPPAMPLFAQSREWALEAMRKAGVELDMGARLHSTFCAAGLHSPHMAVEAAVESGPDLRVWAWANVVLGAVPLMDRMGVVSPAEVVPATLEDRLSAEVRTHGACLIGPLMTRAWARVPERSV
ncbi:MAG: class I SAM-dependent methyltransferase [Nocardioides sp.]|uniref:class I SAM-dependent methyltransferase n=1 Tax=Nocardioides sp. TaxID=35761 RepID=UPI003D6A05A1